MTLLKERVFVRSAAIVAFCLAPLGADAAEWGARVIDFSSQWTKDGSPKWYAIQALGAPNTSSCGDIATAWAGATDNAVAEFITIGYDTPVRATGFSIHETYTAPFVAKVEYIEPNGTPHIAWRGQDNARCNGYLTIQHAATTYPVNAIRVTTRAIPGWKEIDAVRLDGNPLGGGGGGGGGGVSSGGGGVCPPDCHVSPIGSDTNSGSRTAPWRTINRAASLASAGTTVHVAPGRYNETVWLSRSGTPSSRIRFVSDTRWGAKIWPTMNVTTDVIVVLRGNYIDFDGFDLGPEQSNFIKVGLDSPGSFNRVSRNKIHDINFTGTRVGSAMGVGGTGNVIDSNIIYHVGNSSLDHGIYQYDGDSTIINNIIGNTTGYGIHLWHTPHHVKIIGNTVFNNAKSGINVGAGEHSDSYATGCIVANNIAYDNGEYGINEWGATGSNTYVNNLTFGNPSGGYRLQGGNSQTGGINADPRFVNYNAFGTGEYRLQASSPAIDRASARYAPSHDFDGNRRPIAAAPDIGSYEFQK